MTKTQANKLAAIIAKSVGAVKGTAHVGTWLGVPGISIAIHMDKKSAGLRYAIHNVIGEDHCTIRLINGDGRYGLMQDDPIGTVTFDSHAIAQRIADMMPETPLPKEQFDSLLESVRSGELKLSDIEVPPPVPAAPAMVRVRFDMTADDLETLIELIHNTIMDLEDNGNDGDPQAALLRTFVKQIERR